MGAGKYELELAIQVAVMDLYRTPLKARTRREQARSSTHDHDPTAATADIQHPASKSPLDVTKAPRQEAFYAYACFWATHVPGGDRGAGRLKPQLGYQ